MEVKSQLLILFRQKKEFIKKQKKYPQRKFPHSLYIHEIQTSSWHSADEREEKTLKLPLRQLTVAIFWEGGQNHGTLCLTQDVLEIC